MNLLRRERKAVADLAIAMGIAMALAFLNLALNFNHSIQSFFSDRFTANVTGTLVNLLFFWLSFLLWIAFRRWQRESRQRIELEDVISSISPDALIVVTPQRRIEMCNESVERIFGYRPEEVIGKTTDILYHDRRHDRNRKGEIHDALEREGFHVGTATGRRRNGTTVPLEIITGELSTRGGAVLLLRDITERIKAEEERVELEARVRQRQKLESLGVLAGGIAHDFNNLLMGILGNADLVLKGLPPGDGVRRNAEGVRTAAKRAAELCHHLLAYSGKTGLEKQPLYPTQLVREMGDLLAVSIAKNVAIQYDLSEVTPVIEADAAQVRQVVMNFITNASEACAVHGGTITVRAGLRACSAADLRGVMLDESLPSGDYAFIEVEDTGCGMDELTLSRIFDPFFTTKTSGRGLGLAAVLGIVRSHGGCIKVRSRPGQGSCFTVLLPRSQRAAPAASEAGIPSSTDFQGTVLLVDDEEVVRMVGRDMLQYLGFTVIDASDGAEAVRIFEQRGNDIRFVLLDMNMPQMNGEQTLQRIRAIRGDAIVVLSSGYSHDLTQAPDVPVRPDAFVQKPYEIAGLREKLTEVLGRADRTPGA